MTSGLVLNAISINLAGTPLLHVDAEIKPGETLTLMGPSGSGKSSLLAYLGGFLDPAFSATGAAYLDGRDITQLPAHARKTGILFQDPLLFPHMSVGGNLLFALPASAKGAERRERAESALEEAGLGGFFERDPATLSGGQKARVALMRVLLAEPAALLLDEPFSKLDTSRRDQIREFVFTEARDKNLPVVLVTHDQADAQAAGGLIIELE